jgi:guanylate kinase
LGGTIDWTNNISGLTCSFVICLYLLQLWFFSRYTSIAAVESVQAQGKICILDIDVQGVRLVKEQESSSSNPIHPRFIFIAPPSLETLEQRLRGRGTETEEQLQTRLGNAQKELDYGHGEGNFDVILVNAELQDCAEQMAQLFLEWYPHLKEYEQQKESPPSESS